MSMTDNAENVALCNQSLSLLGAKQITVGSGTEQNHIYCTTFFDDSRDEIIASHKWNFAKKRAFAIQTTDPLFGYDNAFTKPSDCVKVWMVEENALAKFEVEGGLILTSEGTTPVGYDDDSVDYLAGQYISSDDSGADLSYLVDTAFTSSSETSDLATYCTSAGADLSVLKVEYVYQATGVDSWPAYMYQCAVYNLALKIAPAIKQDEKAALNLQQMLFGSKNVIGYLDTARSIDAQEQGGVVITTSRFLDSRK
ncbi:hypothetical protein KAR91_50820 [Candidatus Pacearchaeota archaeon]|nr:hypothetical protein [Candidatus Pacearchaeota archaeon]